MGGCLKLILFVCFVLALFCTVDSAAVRCVKARNALSEDLDEFWNEENTDVNFFFPQEEEQKLSSGGKVLFFRRLKRAFRKVTRAVKKTTKKIGSAAKKVTKKVGSGIKKFGSGIKKVTKKIGSGVKKVTKKVGSGIKKVGSGIKKVTKKVGSGIKKVGSTVKRVAKKIGSGVKKVAKKVGSTVKKVAKKIGSGVKKVAKKIGSGVVKAVKKIGSGVKKVVKSTWNGAKNVARTTWRATKKVTNTVWNAHKKAADTVWDAHKKAAEKSWEEVKKVSKLVAKPFVDMVDAVKTAYSKSKRISTILKNYFGPLQKGGCSSRFVCQYDCSDLINCPVDPDQQNGFMDFTSRVKESKQEMQAYKWVCKNSLFSGKNQRESPLSKLFRRIAFGLAKLGDDEFEARNPNFSTAHYDKQYLNWLYSKKIDGNDYEILDILNDYKDGLSGFSKICTENPSWISSLGLKLTEFELNSVKDSILGVGVEADSTVSAFKKISSYKIKQFKLSLTNSAAKYRHTLFESLFHSLRQGFLDLAKGNHIQQEYCTCSDYARFFEQMKKFTPSIREKYYGVRDIDFENAYLEGLRTTCSSKCGVAMKNKGYTTNQISSTLAGLKFHVSTKIKGDEKKNATPKKVVSKKVKNVSKGTKKVISKGIKQISKENQTKVTKKPAITPSAQLSKLSQELKKIAQTKENPFDVKTIPGEQTPTKDDEKNISFN